MPVPLRFLYRYIYREMYLAFGLSFTRYLCLVRVGIQLFKNIIMEDEVSLLCMIPAAKIVASGCICQNVVLRMTGVVACRTELAGSWL